LHIIHSFSHAPEVHMAASKNRPHWPDLPPSVRGQLEGLVGDEVLAAESCQGGFSPGFASRLTLASGNRVFAKAVDGGEWPCQAPMYRDEARVAASLPAGMPVPEFLGSRDGGRWVILAFECIDGTGRSGRGGPPTWRGL
jgi:hypothetical protein